ncbi:hypothetical protein ABW19_dt0202062 [Dactylella cylindrospora]|nr:hypothetical protein ABW19_dt0202062 [Dactylella cylindrospora]
MLLPASLPLSSFRHALNNNKSIYRHLSTLTHSDIPTFLRYAHLSSLNPTKTVFTGTLYEYTVLTALSRLPGVSLSRIGGKDDAGIDLQGTWELPKIIVQARTYDDNDDNTTLEGQTTPPTTEKIKLPLIIQCKFGEKSWKGPQYVRELEGALANQPSNALAVLASVRDMTPGMRRQMLSSRRAIGFVKVTPLEGIYKPIPKNSNEETDPKEPSIEETDETEGSEEVSFRLTGRGGLLQQFVWNEVANRYLGGFGVGARYVPKNYGAQGVDLGDEAQVAEDEMLEQEITLTWNGIPMFKQTDGADPDQDP